MKPAARSAVLRTGVALPYLEQGGPSGIPMLLLHGVTDSCRSFEPVLPYLPGHVHAFALTQRGHGDAGRPQKGYRTRDFADDVAAFIEDRRLGPAVVVGHSMGSTHALRFAIDHPELTRALVLVGAFASYAGNEVLRQLWNDEVSKLVDPIAPSFVRAFQESTLANPVPAAFLDLVCEESLKLPARVWKAVFERFFDDDFAGEVDRIGAPTLLVWGDRDALVPRTDQDRLLAAIEGARLEVYEGIGHAVHWEAPQRFARDVATFAEHVSRARGDDSDPAGLERSGGPGEAARAPGTRA